MCVFGGTGDESRDGGKVKQNMELLYQLSAFSVVCFHLLKLFSSGAVIATFSLLYIYIYISQNIITIIH